MLKVGPQLSDPSVEGSGKFRKWQLSEEVGHWGPGFEGYTWSSVPSSFCFWSGLKVKLLPHYTLIVSLVFVSQLTK